MPRHLHQQTGISLIEALVALAVMAFGVMGVAGLQVTMRQNADISKQRSEAVRIAQEAIENGRSFMVLNTPPAPASGPVARAYQDLKTAGASTVVGYTTNTDYTVTHTVIDSTEDDPSAPRIKTLSITVAWADRSGQTQSVRLNTSVTGVAPELAGSLSIPASVDIPVAAVDQPDGVTSVFTPPGAPALRWVFNNASGVITSICNPAEVCTDTTAFLLSGYVRFATIDTAPTPAQAENPPSNAFALNAQVNLTSPGPQTIACYAQTLPAYVVYYCAVPVSSTPPYQWSGRSVLVSDAGHPIASEPGDSAPGHYKVCRYTPVQGHTPPNGNIDHPLDYSKVLGSLSQQNFLLIRAGNGVTSFACPGDDASTPFVNGNTWPHQPSL
jgi:Tfp pilus assembly protein PilV